MAKVVARVFARRTKATPNDSLAFYDEPGLFAPDVTDVHVSVTFSYDMAKAERLAMAWSRIAPVAIGGPAAMTRGEQFEPGMYLKAGYVITSRGCYNRCWFCSVWKRDGDVRELAIRDGYNVLDDNLLACSKQHIRDVFGMLSRQPEPCEFTGGLEARRLDNWHIDLLLGVRLKQVFFAYDTPDDYEPLVCAAKQLREAGLMRAHKCRCYVLVGYPGDTCCDAEQRLVSTIKLGFMPMAMLYRDNSGVVDRDWSKFQRMWARPVIIGSHMNNHADCSDSNNLILDNW